MVFLGPGSPTYAVRHLRESVAWYTTTACHRQGSALVLASAAAISVSSHALPVYEIYKVGDELHWVDGLDIFGPSGMDLVFVTHWDNKEGGAELDTSRCYMGMERFQRLRAMLPSQASIVGIDEHTALIFDFGAGTFTTMGRGQVTLLRDGTERTFAAGSDFPIAQLGPYHTAKPQSGIPTDIWNRVLAEKSKRVIARPLEPSSDILALVRDRVAARDRGEWDRADSLRRDIASRGWMVSDTPDGPHLTKLED